MPYFLFNGNNEINYISTLEITPNAAASVALKNSYDHLIEKFSRDHAHDTKIVFIEMFCIA